ncbi:MAG: DUF5686 family protein [Candidatus Zhuqueibacterota bacterium]
MKPFALRPIAFAILFSLSQLQPGAAQENFPTFIRQVQLCSQADYDSIHSVNYKGRSKTYAYFGYRPFDIKIVPFLHEYYFDGYWQKPDSIRLIITAERKVNPDTSNIGLDKMIPLPNPFQYLYDPSAFNFNAAAKDSNSEGFWPLYPFAVGADSIYSYKKINEIGFGENTIYTIAVTSKYEHIPAVNGTFQIDAGKHVVTSSNVIFNEAASFTNPRLERDKNRMTLSLSGSENHTVKTEKALVYGSYWLPRIIEEEFEIHFLGMKVNVYRIIEFESYLINPDTDRDEIAALPKISYRTDPALQEKLSAQSPLPNALSKQEKDQIIRAIEDKFHSIELYADLLESEVIASEAARIGLKQRMGVYWNLAQRLGQLVVFNRVEGLRLNYGVNVSNVVAPNSVVSLHAGYGFGDERWKLTAGFLCHLDKNRKAFLETNAYHTIGFEEDRSLITTGKNTFTSALYKGDYRDYFYKDGGDIGFGYRFTDNVAIKLMYRSQLEKTGFNNTTFSLFKHDEPFRPNPEIVQGMFRGFVATALVKRYHFNMECQVEYTDNRFLHSDFSYAFLKFRMNRTFNSWYQDKINIHFFRAEAIGKLSPQRWFDFGGNTFLSDGGNLRSLDYKKFTGDRVACGVAEYVLYGSSLVDMGWHIRYLKAFKLTPWTGLGWSELTSRSREFAGAIVAQARTTDGLFTEVGLGISDRFNMLRFDVMWNSISGNKILFSLNALR